MWAHRPAGLIGKETETTGSKLGDLVLVVVGDTLGMEWPSSTVRRGTLNTDDALTLGRLDNGGNLLGDGVEGEELEDLVAGEDVLGT